MVRASYVLLIGLMLFWTTACFAGPDANVWYLMHDPVSMLDWGIERMNNALESDPQLSPAHPSVSYLWKKNRIEISLIRFIAPQKGKSSPAAQAKTYCEKLLSDVRFACGVMSNGKTVYKGGYVPMATFFQHAGYESKMHPKHLLRGISEIIDMKAWIFYGGKHPLECKGPLVGSSIYFKSH